VFAAAEGVPVTGYAWEPKTISFLAEHGLPAISDPLVPQELEGWLGAAFDRGTTFLSAPRQPDRVRLEIRAAAEQ
jgi:hypothetical protein